MFHQQRRMKGSDVKAAAVYADMATIIQEKKTSLFRSELTDSKTMNISTRIVSPL